MYEDLKAIGMVLLAAALAALVGLEREKKNKPAGMRTHMFIGGGAALLIIAGTALADSFPNPSGKFELQVDPLRLVEAIIVGVSFIGAGTILKKDSTGGESRVSNLTTAATLLFSAGIGVCVAVGRPILAAGVVLAALFINIVMRRVEERWFGG